MHPAILERKKRLQNEYINIVRRDLDPIVRAFGVNIFSNDSVTDILEDVFNSMIPEYKYWNRPGAYLKKVYSNYGGGAAVYNQKANDTIGQIRTLLNSGKTSQAKAIARMLLQRVQENRVSITRDELEWLQGVLK